MFRILLWITFLLSVVLVVEEIVTNSHGAFYKIILTIAFICNLFSVIIEETKE